MKRSLAVTALGVTLAFAPAFGQSNSQPAAGPVPPTLNQPNPANPGPVPKQIPAPPVTPVTPGETRDRTMGDAKTAGDTRTGNEKTVGDTATPVDATKAADNSNTGNTKTVGGEQGTNNSTTTATSDRKAATDTNTTGNAKTVGGTQGGSDSKQDSNTRSRQAPEKSSKEDSSGTTTGTHDTHKK